MALCQARVPASAHARMRTRATTVDARTGPPCRPPCRPFECTHCASCAADGCRGRQGDKPAGPMAAFDAKRSIRRHGSCHQVANRMITEAAKAGAQLVSLPECFNSPYGAHARRFDPPPDVVFVRSTPVLFRRQSVFRRVRRADRGRRVRLCAGTAPFSAPPGSRVPKVPLTYSFRDWQMLSACAKANSVFVIGGSVPERSASGKLFNTSMVFNPNGAPIHPGHDSTGLY